MEDVWQPLEAQAAMLHALLLKLTLRPDTADDLLHDLLVKLSRSPGFLAADNPQAFSRRAAINLAMDWRRRQQRRRTADWPAQEPPARGSGPLQSAQTAEETARILDAVGELTPLSREAFVMRFVEDQTHQAI